jgi:hypothetical protein
MAKLTDPAYPSLPSPLSDDLLIVVDVHNPAESSAGTTSKATVGSLPFMPPPSGTPLSGQVPVATGTGQASAWKTAPQFSVARVFIAGHSYASGYLNTEGGERWPARLAAALHAEEVTYAASGAILAVDVVHGNTNGYPNVLCGLSPRTVSGAAYSVRNAGPYLPLAPAAVFDYGFNDLSRLTSNVTTNIAWFSMALTACCCIARAGGWFPDTDSSVVYTGSWAQNSGAAAYGWPTNHYTTTLNDRVTVTVPANFPGGEIDLLFPAVFGGAKFSTTVDGGSAQVFDGTGSKYGANATDANLCVQRLTGLSAGTHTIVATVLAIDAGAIADFQGWLIAAPSLPVVALVNHPAIPGLPWTVGGAPHTPVTSGDVTALNAAIAAVAASFTDGNVVVADIASAFASAGGNVGYTSPGSLYVSDNGHPNAAGHALIAQTVLAALRAAPAMADPLTPMGLVMRQLNGSLEPPLSAGWSLHSNGTALGWFGKDRAGNCVLRATLQKSSAGTPGETVFTLPPGHQPSGEVIIEGTAWVSGYASSNPARMAVQASGAVQWLSGDPTTELDVYASWQADGLGS